MRRPLPGMFALALASVTAASAVAASPPQGKPSPARVSVAECHPSDQLSDRFAAFSGQMHAIAGTKRMAMHFTLLERLPGTNAFKSVPLPDLRPWRKSKPGAKGFIYTQRVTALHDGGSYRMRVQFRWYGPRRAVLRSLAARSRSCRQPAPLPDLSISSVGSVPDVASGAATYSVSVANTGVGEARNVAVSLRVDGEKVGSSQVDLLPGEESSVVQIPGPACRFGVSAVADPDRSVRETDDSNNTITLPCAQVSP